MIKLITRISFLTLLFAAATLTTKAQIGYDYAQYDIGFGANINRVYGDAETIKATPSVSVSFNYNQTPYINYIVELQAGNLEGGDRLSQSGRYFKNNYTALMFRGQLQMGEILDYSSSGFMNALKGFYVSGGLGYLINNIKETNISRYSTKIQDFYTPGENKSNELILPIRTGYEFKVYNRYNQPSFKIDLGVQYNYDFNDNMDGFTAGLSKDALIQYSIGFKFALGGVTSYRKQINY